MKRALVTAAITGILISSTHSIATAQDPGIYTLISEMRRQSRADALTIKEVYAPLMQSTSFGTRDDLQRALDAGTLVPLEKLNRPNLQPRLSGESPIAQKDMENQPLYVAARPAVLGMLMSIADRVEGAPLEVTSLVRTAEYQRALMRGNGNANTDVPTHVMGYAVDIGLKYMPADTANSLRQVLEEMREAGDIYFIGEANQLTFHIVPVPSRIPHFEEVFRRDLEAAQQAEAEAPVAHAPEASAPVAQPAPSPEPSRLAGIWSWITELFD